MSTSSGPRTIVFAYAPTSARALGRMAGGALSVAVLGCIIGFAVNRVSPIPIEQRALAGIAAGYHPLLTSLMTWVSDLGDLWVVAVAAVLLAPLLRRLTRGWEAAVLLGMALLGSLLITAVIKAAVGRERPLEALVEAQSGAFPSGHTSRAAAVLGLGVWGVTALARSPVVRAAAVGMLASGVLLMGFSRMYLGVHWPTDVAFGMGLGVWWLFVLLHAVQPRVRSAEHVPRDAPQITAPGADDGGPPVP